jgi:hypothetical protein
VQGNASRWTWTKPKAEAATLLASDTLTDEQIAAKVSVNDATLWRWKQHPEFTARVAATVEEFRRRVVARGIAEKQNRVDALNDRWQRMQHIITARADEYADDPPVPGAEEGLHVRTVKLSATGLQVEEYTVDTGLLKELRAHEEQAAKELGQWVEKQDLSGVQAVRIEYVNDWRADPQ